MEFQQIHSGFSNEPTVKVVRAGWEMLRELETVARTVAKAVVKDFTSTREIYNWVAATAYELAWRIDALVTRGVTSDAISTAIVPAVEAWCKSPFVSRMRTWPRGYAGDFETIEYLCDGVNRAAPDTMAYHFERFFLSSPAVFQHRAKLEAQSTRIATACFKRRHASILILAVGGGRDLLTVLEVAKGTEACITINDADQDALRVCPETLDWIAELSQHEAN
jgi:extracellular factor (EF) 3-hydroxypalmitic acid methyl ester biosynthesis protein